MERPSGIFIVTAGLGALVLFHVVWSWGAQRPPVWAQKTAASSDVAATVAFDPAFQLNTGAWRAIPVAMEKMPPPAPVEDQSSLLAPNATATSDAAVEAAPAIPRDPAAQIPAQAAPAAVGPAPASRVMEPVVSASAPAQAPPQDALEPSTPPLDAAPSAAPSAPREGRMGLAGPQLSEHQHVSAPRLAREGPKPQDPPLGETLPTRTEHQFGPTVFREVERNGF